MKRDDVLVCQVELGLEVLIIPSTSQLVVRAWRYMIHEQTETRIGIFGTLDDEYMPMSVKQWHLRLKLNGPRIHIQHFTCSFILGPNRFSLKNHLKVWLSKDGS